MSVFYINTADLPEKIPEIRFGDEVYLSGTVYTARDAAHKKIKELLENKKPLPFELKNACIYYAGPTPEPPSSAIGSCGPTTSSRMDVFTPYLMDNGLVAMIGKGPRNEQVVQSIKKHKGVYFCAIGGAGALAAMCIKSFEVIAFEELGCESVKRLEVENFPVLCAIDCLGGNIFKKG
ncbi:MAG: fumarate hydratase C-terminal domain-containing protein [Clostridia bacterium]|nr:fumarate hydratase C-terminal domain-containing protein [Clostridia bacterium]